MKSDHDLNLEKKSSPLVLLTVHSYANDGAEQEYAVHFCVSVKGGKCTAKNGAYSVQRSPWAPGDDDLHILLFK